MKLHPISLFLLLALGALSASAQALTGDWSGRLDAGQARLSLTFHFTLHEGRYTGSMDSPDQGAYGIEADSVVTDGHRLSVCLSKAGIRYDYSVTGSTDPGRAREGFSGLSFQHAAELRVFVRPGDYEQALYLVRRALREAGEGE